jgi:hypothetical protein
MSVPCEGLDMHYKIIKYLQITVSCEHSLGNDCSFIGVCCDCVISDLGPWMCMLTGKVVFERYPAIPVLEINLLVYFCSEGSVP